MYETQCDRCKEEGKESIYVGESSRSSYERGKEHDDDYNKKKEDSHMEKHSRTSHSAGEKPSFSMKIIKTHQNAFQRQIHEAVRIRRRAQDAIILNSKSEYNRCKLPRLMVEDIVQEKLEEEGQEGGGELVEIEKMKEKRKGEKDDRPTKRRKKWKGGYADWQVWGEES